MIFKVLAKCDDRCVVVLLDNKGQILQDSIGYVPSILPIGSNDTVEFEIDVETGQILNWKQPTPEEIEYFIVNGDDQY